MITWSALDNNEQQAALARPALADNQALSQTVAGIITDIRANGDTAVLNYTRKFDCPELQNLPLSVQQRDALASQVSDDVQQAIRTAFSNIEAFHQAQMPSDIVIDTMPGVRCEQKFAPLEAVGLYIPGGSAPLPSTVMMLGIPAKVAGCERKVLCTPPNREGQIAPEIAFAAQLADIEEIYLCGGAQAIAAMAFGTETIAKVDKIFGPGNSFVTEAKQQVSQSAQGAAIDMPAGPSEVLVLADADADAEFVAADLLSQAEHGADSQAILVCECETKIAEVEAAVDRQLALLSRNDIATAAMQHARYIKTDSLTQSFEVSNAYAPEHLIVQVENTQAALPKLKNAGSIFVGAYSPESAGDYASGTNHVLPTYGYAKNYSSLGLLDFMRRYTVQEITQDGMRLLGPTIMKIAAAEGLDAHEKAVAVRMAKLNDSANTIGKDA